MSAATVPLRLTGCDGPPDAAHPLHARDRLYPETNCYTDVLIELLHARGLEPLAVLGATLACDFDGDQWTFFKPAADDLRDLLGVHIRELMPYRDRPLQIAEQLRAGRTQLLETDAWHLPDTAGLTYRRAHVKTTIGVAGIDLAAGRLEYFHNGGRYTLDGRDFHAALEPAPWPLYAELVRFDAGVPLRGPALQAAARERLAGHVRRRPAENPYTRLGAWLDERWPAVEAGDEPPVHERIFATARMAGAAAELGAAHVEWALGREGAAAAGALTSAAAGCKVLAFRLARGRPFDAAACVAPLAAAWDEGVDALDGLA